MSNWFCPIYSVRHNCSQSPRVVLRLLLWCKVGNVSGRRVQCEMDGGQRRGLYSFHHSHIVLGSQGSSCIWVLKGRSQLVCIKQQFNNAVSALYLKSDVSNKKRMCLVWMPLGIFLHSFLVVWLSFALFLI